MGNINSEHDKSPSIHSVAHLNFSPSISLGSTVRAIPPPARRRAGRQVGVTSTNPETSGQVGGGLRAPSILAAAHFPCPHSLLPLPPGGEAQAMMSSWVANTKHINIVLMIIIITA